MTAQVASTTHNTSTHPDTALAHAITMATLVTEAAVVIGTTDVHPVAITVREVLGGPFPWAVQVQLASPDDTDEIGRVLALPVIDYGETLHTRAWDGVSLAGHLVTVRVYSGRRPVPASSFEEPTRDTRGNPCTGCREGIDCPPDGCVCPCHTDADGGAL